MSKKALYTLRRGAVPYKRENGEGGILYPIHPKDSEEQIKEKLAQVLEVYAVAPNRFDDIQEDKIKKILSGESGKKAEAKPLVGAALAAANKKAAKEAAAIAEAEAKAAEAAAIAEAEAKAAEAAAIAEAEAKAAEAAAIAEDQTDLTVVTDMDDDLE